MNWNGISHCPIFWCFDGFGLKKLDFFPKIRNSFCIFSKLKKGQEIYVTLYTITLRVLKIFEYIFEIIFRLYSFFSDSFLNWYKSFKTSKCKENHVL